METIKNTVASVLGTNKSHETDATTDSSLGHHNTASGATTDSTVGHSTAGTTGTTGTTGLSGTTSDAAPSFHDRTTTGGDSTHSHGTSGTGGLSSGGDTGLSHGATGTSTTGASDLSSGRDTTAASGTTGLGHSSSHTSHSHDTQTDDPIDRKDVQSPDQGPDPNLTGDASGHPKMVGEGAPGSHSALFGLTPDGKKHDATSSGTTPIRPAHSDETSLGRKSVAPGGHGGVSDQIDAPDTGKKGLERTDPAPISASNSGGKPGAGLTGLGQS